MQKFTDITTIVWDLDGTLYPPTPQMSQAILNAAYDKVQKELGWDMAKVKLEFHAVYGKITQSQTETVAMLCNITTPQAAVDIDRHFTEHFPFQHDAKLTALFETLSGLQHIMLCNGAVASIHKRLGMLGLDSAVFSEIVTSEIVGVNKPHENGFQYILEKSISKPAQHLMVGDRVEVDLLPAKKLGMRTCLVWSPKPSPHTDATVPTVYELAQLFLS